MKEINIKGMYPHVTEDCFVPVTEELVEALCELNRQTEAYRRNQFRHKAQYSLDRDDGIDLNAINAVPSPEDIYLQKEHTQHILAELRKLSRPSARRIYKHFYLDWSVDKIARHEGVSTVSVYESIREGIKKLRNSTTFVECP